VVADFTENGDEMKMYAPSWFRVMTFAAPLVTLTATSAMAQGTISLRVVGLHLPTTLLLAAR